MKWHSEGQKGLSLKTRILLVCALMFLASFVITVRTTSQTQDVTNRMEESFYSNRQLLTVLQLLQDIENDVGDFLNTRSTDSLEDYYDHVRLYRESIASFETASGISDNAILQKNIVGLSESYLACADETIAQKRGRDIDAYQTSYSELEKLNKYLRSMVEMLNSRQFAENAVVNEVYLSSARITQQSQRLLLGIIVIIGIFLLFMLQRMVDPIDSAMREKEIRVKEQVKDAELKYLRAQVNPHFLFNTLNAGTQLAMLEGADKTYQYLHKVAGFYRTLVREEAVSWELKKEVGIVDDFMYIINVRYGGEIHFEKQIDETLLSVFVPFMILQPIVENCVKHGWKDEEREKKVNLTIKRENEQQFSVTIKDNGMGMEDEVKEQLLREPDYDEPVKEGIGIRNVQRRLRMYYEAEHILEIESGKEGTQVRLLLPLTEEEDIKETDVQNTDRR